MPIAKALNMWVNPRNAFYLLIAIYTAGLIGLSAAQTQSLFQQLTPFNLLLSGMILFHFETTKNKPYFVFLIICIVLGFSIEVIGVKTGFIFGEYNYSNVLGPRLLDVPIIIGLNWVILVYCSGILAKSLVQNIYIRAFIGSSLMTLLDFFIEPVAVALNFWQWEAESIPMKNYLAWFVFSYALVFLYLKILPNSSNPIAIRLLLIIISFFILLNFI